MVELIWMFIETVNSDKGLHKEITPGLSEAIFHWRSHRIALWHLCNGTSPSQGHTTVVCVFLKYFLCSGHVSCEEILREMCYDHPASFLQLRNHNRVKAPTAERAASLLDAAIAARRHNDFITYLSHSSIMFFTLHVQPPRTESSTIGKGSNELLTYQWGLSPVNVMFSPWIISHSWTWFSVISCIYLCSSCVLFISTCCFAPWLPCLGTRGPTKLTLIDVCSGMRGMSKNKPPYYEMGPVVLSLLSGPKASPAK